MKKIKLLPSLTDRKYNVNAIIIVSAAITMKNKAEDEHSAGRDDVLDM